MHPTAMVDSSAEVGLGCRIDPYTVIGANARIGAGTILHPFVVIDHDTTIGSDCRIGTRAVIGEWAQNRYETEENGSVQIGDRVMLGNGVTISRGSGNNATLIGDDVMLMEGVHVGHDSSVGARSTIANGSMLAGYVRVGSHCTLYAQSAVQQQVRIGDGVMTGGKSAVRRDIPPYCIADGMHDARLRSANKKTLRDVLKLSDEEIINFRKVLRRLLRAHEDVETVAAERQEEYVQELYAFLRGKSAHGVMAWSK